MTNNFCARDDEDNGNLLILSYRPFSPLSVIWTKHTYFGLLRKGLDAGTAGACWFLATRMYSDGVDRFFLQRIGGALVLLTVYFFSREGLYRSYRLRSRMEEVQKICRAHVLTLVTLGLIFLLVDQPRVHKGWMVLYFFLGAAGLIGVRMATRDLLHYIRRQGRDVRHVLLVGHSAGLEQYVRNVQALKDSGIRLLGWHDDGGLAARYDVAAFTAEEVWHHASSAYSIVVGYAGEDANKSAVFLQQCHDLFVPIVVVPDLGSALAGCQIEQIAGVPVFIVNQPDFSTTTMLAKRAFDLFGALLGCTLLLPLLALIACGVKWSSPGPVLFSQRRTGLHGRSFRMWKFRSMRVGAEADQQWTTPDDPRRTRFGTFLRSTSLDELPQLWNVLRGDMSLVGPRPEQPLFVEKFRQEIPLYNLRHKMKPGITGWAQVNGWRGDTSIERRVDFDLYYIRNWTLWLDLKILLLTFIRGFIHSNAY